MRALAIALLAVAAACTPVELRQPPATRCAADGLGDLIGKRASDARGDVLLKRSGARTLRWIAPDSAVTMDLRDDRLNVHVDGKGRIERLRCG
jgi:hypothetical protein